ncbi:DNA polymerase I [Huintestinicola sp.]|uniref:DNA polymerase I n=1 Tax=Huintestinicola sp. TaxID=2981661 RepID=UPI003D7D2E35
MKLLAIDGNSIMNRAFYGIKALSNKKGVFTNALTGFMNIYLKTAAELSPEGCAVAFDLREPTFRHKANAAYKATRHGMPEELAMQMPLIKKLLTALGIKILECPGFEADDILGTLSTFGNETDHVYILTGDRDSLQLINENVTVLLHTTKELITCTPEKFSEMYEGLSPLQLIDLKALMGDSSDNISGVKGIGEKTALSLIKEYSSVETLYEKLAAGEVTATKSVLAKLTAGEGDAKESKWLATIVKNAPISLSMGDYAYGERDEAALSRLLTELEMTKLMERLNVKPSAALKAIPEAEKEKAVDYKIAPGSVSDIKGGFAFILKRTETGAALYTAYEDKLSVFENESDIISLLSSEYEKQTFGAKPAYRYMLEKGSELKNIVSDADISGYLLNASASEYTIKGLCAEYGCPDYENLGEYSDIAAISGLCRRLDRELSETGAEKLCRDIELPLTEVLASMEHFGVKADTEGIRKFGETLSEEIAGLEQQIYFRAGKQFNISSPKQLGVILFEEMGLPSGKKTKTGYSTGAEVLEELRDKDPIIDMILTYRQYTKLQSTYVEGLLKTVGGDGRIHSVFKQTETRTGRISSTEPNLQNIPVRTELGRNMRKFFVSEEGRVLIDADYSQIELRILAHLSGDKNMQAIFNSGGDIHTSTAAQVFGMPEDMVTPEMRRAAKAVNFGIVYGISAFSLSKDIDVSVAKADRYIKSYLTNFSGVAAFMDKAVTDAAEKGYSETIFGRRRYIPELAAKNKNIQSFGKRAAMNAPVQGAAADIIKIAMVKVYRRLKEENLDAQLILQIHDELIIEASEKDAARAAKVLGEEMRGAVQLDVPLTADVETGKSWFECH